MRTVYSALWIHARRRTQFTFDVAPTDGVCVCWGVRALVVNPNPKPLTLKPPKPKP
jgi:hypothetical protein